MSPPSVGPLTFVCVFFLLSLSNPKLTSFFVRFFFYLSSIVVVVVVLNFYTALLPCAIPPELAESFYSLLFFIHWFLFLFSFSFVLLKRKFDHFSLFVPCWTIHPCPPSSSSSSISTSYLPTQIPTQKKKKKNWVKRETDKRSSGRFKTFNKWPFPVCLTGKSFKKYISLIRLYGSPT